MDFKTAFGSRLRDLRIQAGLTQEQLAEAVRLSPGTISNIERGRYSPNLNRLPPLARGVNREVYELFKFDGPPGWRMADE